MRLTVRLFGDLRRYLPRGQESLQLELPEGSTTANLLQQVGIHPGEVWIVRANKQVISEGQPLRDGDDVEVFEPVGGG
ncbi:MAG: MoaD/ThiS family protein [Chloroflexota bacterium]